MDQKISEDVNGRSERERSRSRDRPHHSKSRRSRSRSRERHHHRRHRSRDRSPRRSASPRERRERGSKRSHSPQEKRERSPNRSDSPHELHERRKHYSRSRSRSRSRKRRHRSRSHDRHSSRHHRRRSHRSRSKDPPLAVVAASVPPPLPAAPREGEYGSKTILKRVDMAAKRFEFEAWLREVKKLKDFVGGKRETEDMFAEFCEDWNMCILPEKFYDIEAWEKRQAAAAALGAGGNRSGKEAGSFSLAREDDERRAALALEAQRKARERADLLRLAASSRALDPNAKKREDLIAAAQYAFKKGDNREQQRLLAKISDMDKEAEAAKWR